MLQTILGIITQWHDSFVETPMFVAAHMYSKLDRNTSYSLSHLQKDFNLSYR